MKPLTARQRQVFDTITRSLRDRGYPPSIREIGRATEIGSNNGVNDHLIALERKGWIERDANRARGIRVLNKEGIAQ